MGREMLERDDLSVYIIAGVPRSFKRKLQKFVEQEAKGDGDVMQLDDDFRDWVIARLLNEKRRRTDRTPATSALWRAFSALSAARYHLKDDPADEDRVREMRSQVEALWRELSPLFNEESEAEEENASAGK
ncbi:MAG: hypothetical protein ACRELV_07980 [Longimicrobiales bacterium]